MDCILTLVADPKKKPLDPSTVESAGRALAQRGAKLGALDWLGTAEACDLPFAGLEPATAQDIARAALGAAPIDAVAQGAGGRRKHLLVADMDATIIEGETIDKLAAEAGIGSEIAAITEAAMRGEIDFPTALKQRVALLKGLREAALLKVRGDMHPVPGARALVATMRKHGAYTVLVSGGFDLFTHRACELLGFDEERGNRLEISGGRLTGRVPDPILGRDAKLMALTVTAAKRGIDMRDTMAVGDGANDLDMIRAAGMGIAFRAKPVVAAAAQARIDHADLRALLYVQGYRREEFAGG